MFDRNDYAFVLAIKADIAVGESIVSRSGEKCEKISRSAVRSLLCRKFIFLGKHSCLLNCVIGTFNFSFRWVGYAINFLFFVKALVLRLWSGRRVVPYRAIVLANAKGRNFGQLMENAGYLDSGKTWIIVRDRDFPKVNERLGCSVWYLSLLSYREILDVLCVANRQLGLVKRCCGSENALHALKAFGWYAYRQALLNCMPCEEIVFVSIRDRWYFLYQSLGSVRKVLVQHGNIARGPDGQQMRGQDLVPYRQTSVDKLFCYDEQEEMAFRSMIRNIGEVVYFTPRIELSPVDRSRPSVLLICCVLLYSKIEERIIHRISIQYPNVDLYVKPHPSESDLFYRRLRKRLSFHLIRDICFFPKTNLVLSYHSTLASEYERSGIKVLYFTDCSTSEINNLDILKALAI